MKGEIYYWIIFLLIVVGAALYLRYYYKPGINISLNFSASPTGLYQYQKAVLNLTVTNKGSAVKDFDLGIYMNNSLLTAYNITLGSGKQTLIQFNHTFSAPGTFTFSAIGDPADLYNVVNRQSARSNAQITILPIATPNPASLLPANAITVYSSQTTAFGYGVATYLNSNYNVKQLELSNISSLNLFLYPILNQTSSYIANLSSAGGDYAHSEVYSLWISGEISPLIFGVAAQGKGLNYTNANINGKNVTVVKVDNYTSLCSWYSGGWVRALAFQGIGSCSSILTNQTGASLNLSVGKHVHNFGNSSILGNFTSNSGVYHRFGSLSLVGNLSLLYSVLWKNGPGSTICDGVVSYIGNVSYCSTYMSKTSGAIGNLSLIRTTAFVGGYNESAFSLANSSKISTLVGLNIGVLNSFNITGKSLNFTSGLSNSCSLGPGFRCSNVTYGNSRISFNVMNKMNSSVELNSIGCYYGGAIPSNVLKINLPVNRSTTVNASCTNNGYPISGVALNLNLKLLLNYSIGGKAYNATGSAYIV